ncbi:uncharacterized protein LOC135149309 [Daucus carota subsp. sativus]|uniref:uncharacterized protein LOC135149309 n=1 Tax=Daucus carota subsp. sativus TaxID=79200 RepID=UPI0030833B7A
MLLAYWNDESIQYKARKNARSRSKYAETHTAGPRSLAQIRNEMIKEADGTAPSDAEVFVKTRKRNPGREYKTDTKKISEKVDDIEKQIKISGDGTDELLLSGGKKHGKTWLYGRCPNAAKVPRSTSSRNSYVEDLACKIKESLADDVKESVSKQVQEEVDAQVNKKVQQNLTLALKKIAEANPGIKINMEDFCPPASSDDENGTPITGGGSC